MSVLDSRPGLRWLVPAGAALAVIGGGLAVGAIAAAADPSLPQRSAAQLLVDLQTARLDGLSGTVVQTADLGLPALPNLSGGQGSSDLTSLVAGTHTLRVWYSGPTKARVALLGTLGESDIITNGTDVWTWSSKENKATHRTVSPNALGRPDLTPTPNSGAGAGGMTMTPQQLANLALAVIDPSTEVATNGSATIAGRDAYELVLTPRDKATKVASIRLAIDAVEHVPLQVQLYARGMDTPAIEVHFTQVSFTRPDDQQFTFNPPPGVTVEEVKTPLGADLALPSAPHLDALKRDASKPDAGKPEAGGDAGRPVTIGTGWTSVLVAKLPKPVADAAKPADPAKPSGDPSALLKNLPVVSGSWGSGHLLTSHLFSVLLTDDGRVLAGAVTPDALYRAAADPKAQLGS